MSDFPSLVERIAKWSHAAKLDAIPKDAQKAAKRCIVDLVGVSIAGAEREQSRRIADYASRAYAPGAATVIGSPARLSPVGAALVNGTVGHVLDFDDTSYTGIMHGSTVVFPAALAAAESAGADGRRLLEAFVAGSEVTYAVAILCGHGHYHKGWWSTATFGTIGAAAAAAKALDLSVGQTACALSLASLQSGAQKAAFGTDAKPYLAGQAAAAGVESALLASGGLSAPRSALEGRNGFIRVLNDGVADYEGIEKLGKQWRLVDPGIFFKRYPVCSAAHAATEVTQRLMDNHGLKAESIRQVVCEVPPLVATSLVYDIPGNLQEAQFSMPFAVGTMLARGRLGVEELTEEAISNPGVRSCMSKIEMRRVDSLEDEEAPEGARVTLVIDGGGEISDYLGVPMGMPGNPMSDEQLYDKFLRCAAVGGLEQDRANALLNYMANLESASLGLFGHGLAVESA